ncbi:unannotated protein [freshwater metagenome]|uniref:Unannotated protein n=1 Tax=freshwater metagenome TaxID=449393 RepID=A0A6J6MKL9_9ZZZZ
MSEDFPALGKPTSAISATDFNSNCKIRSSPGSPRRAKPGARRLEEESAKFPSPPKPPWAATNVVPVPMRSAICTPA